MRRLYSRLDSGLFKINELHTIELRVPKHVASFQILMPRVKTADLLDKALDVGAQDVVLRISISDGASVCKDQHVNYSSTTYTIPRLCKVNIFQVDRDWLGLQRPKAVVYLCFVL